MLEDQKLILRQYRGKSTKIQKSKIKNQNDKLKFKIIAKAIPKFYILIFDF